MNKKYIVYWFKGKRIGSVEFTLANWIQTKKEFYYRIIQTDITGTMHLDIIGIKNNKA